MKQSILDCKSSLIRMIHKRREAIKEVERAIAKEGWIEPFVTFVCFTAIILSKLATILLPIGRASVDWYTL